MTAHARVVLPNRAQMEFRASDLESLLPEGHQARQAARLRAAREREARVAEALARLPELAAIKRRQGKAADQARASTTDAEATVMKMGDGGPITRAPSC